MKARLKVLDEKLAEQATQLALKKMEK